MFRFNDLQTLQIPIKIEKSVQTLPTEEEDVFEFDDAQGGKSLRSKMRQNKLLTASTAAIFDKNRKDPEEEFFRLAVFCAKLCINENGKEVDFEVSTTSLFNQVRDEGVPFQHWYTWIQEQVKLISLRPSRNRSNSVRGGRVKRRNLI